jgi:hypothetical protein
MTTDQEVQCTAARLVMRHGSNAPRFAEMIAREMARAGKAVDSRHWQAVAQLAGATLANMGFRPRAAGEGTSLPSGPYDRRQGAN